MTSSTLLQHRVHNNNSRLKWDESIPPILRPLLRAYVLGYASSVGPRVVTLVLQHVARGRRRRKRGNSSSSNDLPKVPNIIQPPREPFVQSLCRILRCGFHVRRFPAFCAAFIGGTTLLEVSEWGLHSALGAEKVVVVATDLASNDASLSCLLPVIYRSINGWLAWLVFTTQIFASAAWSVIGGNSSTVSCYPYHLHWVTYRVTICQHSHGLSISYSI